MTALLVLVSWTLIVAMTAKEGFRAPISYFSFAVGSSGVPVAYPFLVLLPVLMPLSQQLQKRWIFYTRTRISPQRYLSRVALLNAAMAFGVFFAYVMIMFPVLYFCGPQLGVVYDPSSYTVPAGYQEARLTELIDVNPYLYAIAYGAWQGLNAAVWATVGFVAVFLFRKRILAFAFPFAVFAVLTMLMTIAGAPMAWNTPWLLWVLFSVSDVPFLPSVITLCIFAAVAALAAAWVIRRSHRLAVMQ